MVVIDLACKSMFSQVSYRSIEIKTGYDFWLSSWECGNKKFSVLRMLVDRHGGENLWKFSSDCFNFLSEIGSKVLSRQGRWLGVGVEGLRIAVSLSH